MPNKKKINYSRMAKQDIPYGQYFKWVSFQNKLLKRQKKEADEKKKKEKKKEAQQKQKAKK